MYYILIRMELIRRKWKTIAIKRKSTIMQGDYNDSYSVVSFVYAQIS